MDAIGLIVFAIFILLMLAAIVIPQVWPEQSQAYQQDGNNK